MKTTVSARNEQFQSGELTRAWHLVDAEGKTLGRMATQIAKILQGKHKPIYTPHVDTGDYVIVVNAEKIKVSGNKVTEKMYYHHTGYPGGLKAASFQELLEKKPTEAVAHAVKGMMPKNKLNRDALDKLKVYAGSEHPHQANQPQPLDI